MAELMLDRSVRCDRGSASVRSAPDSPALLALQSLPGDFIVLSWLYPRAAHWTLDRHGIRGRLGETSLQSRLG